MIVSDIAEEIYFSLSSNKSRSALTILGIVIGIASVIAMISVGQGATKDISDRIQSLGTNLLVVSPGSQRQSGNIVRGGAGSSQSLTTEDADALRPIQFVQSVAPVASSRKQVVYKGKNTNTSIYGIDVNYFQIRNVEVENGVPLSQYQVQSRAKAAVLGPTTAIDLFGEGVNPIGQKIKINGQEFLVIGVTKAKGGSGMGSSDDLIYAPITTVQQYMLGNESVSNVNVQVENEESMTFVQEQIKFILLARHRITNEANADFSIMNQADMLETMSSIAGTMTLLLGAIAGISLVVGGIGIMNMMLTTVTERTREIGLRKSLGAKNSDISLQFLAESVALTFIGGVIGVIIGWFASWLIGRLSGLSTLVTYNSIFLSVGISAFIGILFGYYPAKSAAKLNPIEALRYQ